MIKVILKRAIYSSTNIEINLPKYINRKNIDYLLLLSWNIKSEILKQERNFLRKGGRFITPFPRPKILNESCNISRWIWNEVVRVY